jgi:hypothetical protein
MGCLLIGQGCVDTGHSSRTAAAIIPATAANSEAYCVPPSGVADHAEMSSLK